MPEAASRAITRIKLSKPTTNLQGNSQKGPTASIKLTKKSYRSKALLRVFNYRVERCKKTAFPKKINSEKMFTNVFLYQITPFRSKVSFFEPFCSFKVGCFTAIKIPPGFFLRNIFWCCLQSWKTMFNVLKELFD